MQRQPLRTDSERSEEASYPTRKDGQYDDPEASAIQASALQASALQASAIQAATGPTNGACISHARSPWIRIDQPPGPDFSWPRSPANAGPYRTVNSAAGRGIATLVHEQWHPGQQSGCPGPRTKVSSKLPSSTCYANAQPATTSGPVCICADGGIAQSRASAGRRFSRGTARTPERPNEARAGSPAITCPCTNRGTPSSSAIACSATCTIKVWVHPRLGDSRTAACTLRNVAPRGLATQ